MRAALYAAEVFSRKPSSLICGVFTAFVMVDVVRLVGVWLLCKKVGVVSEEQNDRSIDMWKSRVGCVCKEADEVELGLLFSGC